MATLTDATYLLDKLKIKEPLVAVYDAPADSDFYPVIQPLPQRHTCIFAYHHAWLRGQTLKLTSTNFGCLGCGYWLFGKEGRTRKEMVNFLVDTEGLKCSKDAMERWLSINEPYHSKHKTLFIGPFRSSKDDFLKTVTFFVNADQLSALVIAANYVHNGESENPVTIPFGSGCMQLLTLPDSFDQPHAIVGSTDLAMRGYLSPDILSFTVNRSMFEKLCTIGRESFLEKGFLTGLQNQRAGEKK